MKRIGLLGGMSWASTAVYYRLINERVAARLGGLHSARILLDSFDLHEVDRLQRADRWDQAGDLLAAAGQNLARAGADFLVICSNTMHKVAPAVARTAGLPLLLVTEITGAAVKAAGITRVGLLGTRFTMAEPFYRRALAEQGLEVLLPDDDDRKLVDEVIFSELCRGALNATSRREYQRIIAALAANGAQGIILGCTEISLLIDQSNADLPLFDTTALHAHAAADFAIAA
jgi:aspartate racemase